MVKYDNPVLFLFAKAPVAGQVKTRMQTELGAAVCAALAEKMLLDSVEKVTKHWPGEFVLSVSPDTEHAVFHELQHRCNLTLLRQVEGDLGVRMQSVLQQGIQSSGAAAVMGCDVPHIDGNIIAQAGQKLINGEQVIGPAIDGGFYFLGLTDFPQSLFDNIPWGGSTVRGDVMTRARDANMSITELPMLRDIDRYADLQWLANSDMSYAGFL